MNMTNGSPLAFNMNMVLIKKISHKNSPSR